MTLQYKCNACGAVVEVEQHGAEGADCVGPDVPPAGWRAVWTMIEESENGAGSSERYVGEVLHSCADCNAHMTVDEHLDAEFASRKRSMSVKP